MTWYSIWKTQKTPPPNYQKSVAFLYTSNEAEEREIKELIPFTIAPKTIRYLGINLPKEVKDLYSEKYRTLMKEIEEDIKKWKNRGTWVAQLLSICLRLRSWSQGPGIEPCIGPPAPQGACFSLSLCLLPPLLVCTLSLCQINKYNLTVPCISHSSCPESIPSFF